MRRAFSCSDRGAAVQRLKEGNAALSTDTISVVWFFERSGRFVRCETRDVPGVFELVIVEADGTERVERFDDSDMMFARQQQLASTLKDDGWQGPFGRFI